MSDTSDNGVTPSGSGCQPTASAASASSLSDIPDAAFTPGPYSVDRHLWAGDTIVVDSDGCRLASTASPKPYDENIANAHLLAASWDMYRALKSLRLNVIGLRAFEADLRNAMGNTNWEVLMHKADEAAEALAKAHGEAA